MGAEQSSQNDTRGNIAPIKTSYYVLLGVDRDATEDEIKKAYRRKALELHPDRNHGREEESTKLFADVQGAYEVLSDPQERSWYDSHENAILRGFEGGEDGKAADEFQYGGIKLTTTAEISKVVSRIAVMKVDYDNVPDKFFSELKSVFENIADEESRAARMEGLADSNFPTFGDREDSYEDVVKSFYAGWSGFATARSYSWVDKWNMSEAPDRRYRRAMEKENKQERQDAIKEFNDAVRNLVGFVRKRDPRYRPNFQSDGDRQQALREAAQAQAAKARKANAARAQAIVEAIPEWAKGTNHEDEEEEESEEEVVEEIECVACHKTFKSDKQYEAHERSKKHQKALNALKRRMRKDNEHLDLDDAVASGAGTPQEDEYRLIDDHNGTTATTAAEVESLAEDLNSTTVNDNGNDDIERDLSSEESNDNDDTNDDETTPATIVSPVPSLHEDQPQAKSAEPKMGKAAQKRAKRAAKAANGQADEATSICAQCNASFSSRSRLFQHIKDFGHAAPVGAVKTGRTKKSKR